VDSGTFLLLCAGAVIGAIGAGVGLSVIIVRFAGERGRE
jgi:hypothetical protein